MFEIRKGFIMIRNQKVYKLTTKEFASILFTDFNDLQMKLTLVSC